MGSLLYPEGAHPSLYRKTAQKQQQQNDGYYI